MAEEPITLKQVLVLAHRLTPLEKVRLIEQVAPDLEATLTSPSRAPAVGGTLGELADSPLCGLWADRTDIEDSVEFAAELRRQAGQRSHG